MDGSIPVDYVPELRTERPWLMEEMVAAEPSLVEPVLGSAQSARGISDLIKKAADDKATVAVTGCGTSETAAMAVSELLREALHRAGNDRPVVHPRQALEASLDPWPGGVCLGISHEGSTRATILALEAAKRAGAATALITARAESAGTKAADRVFVTPLVDRSWCHTVGYFSPIMAGAAIAGALSGSRPDAAGLENALAEWPDLSGQAGALAKALFVDRFVITGAGADRSPARELALKIEEGVWLPARMLDLETVLHGHLAACDSRTALVIVATDARERLMVRTTMVAEAARRIGMRVGAIVSADVNQAMGFESERIVLPNSLGAFGLIGRLSGAAVALQRLTLALSALAGTNPDLIRRQQEPYREAARIAESATDW
jgi:fructoselysine-6-P-deglycase FrlB-like protein